MQRLVLVSVVFALLALNAGGCGFHLRSWELGNAYESVGLVTRGDLDLEGPLLLALGQTGVPVLDSGAELVLELMDSAEELRTASVSGSARVAEYELIQRVRYAVRTADGEYLARPTTTSTSRRYFLDRGNLVGSNEEQALLRRELRAELVQRIMRVLNTVSRQPKPGSGATNG